MELQCKIILKNEHSPTYRITDLEATERPRERLARLGAQALSSAELLAILLRVGVHGENAVQVGQRLIQTMGGLAQLDRTRAHGGSSR